MTRLKLTSQNTVGAGLTSKAGYGGRLLKTRQTTAYHVGDDGDIEAGLPASYSVLTTGQFSGTTAIDTPHYAAAGISFVAPDLINDAGAGLITFLTTDTIRVRGSALNDGVYTIETGGVAGQIVTNEVTIVNEGAGAYVTLCKRSTPSNNVVLDNVTGLMWRRYTTGRTGAAERIGNVSDGNLNWYNTATCFTLHPAAADLQMIVAPPTLRIVGGAGEVARYFVGMVIDPSGFVAAVNNMPGYVISAVTVNGADLDLSLWTCKNTLATEAAAGARDIRVVCRSIFAYAAAVNVVAQAGYSDWRNPTDVTFTSLRVLEGASFVPDPVAFPLWPASYFWSSSTRSADASRAHMCGFAGSSISYDLKTSLYFCELIRG